MFDVVHPLLHHVTTYARGIIDSSTKEKECSVVTVSNLYLFLSAHANNDLFNQSYAGGILLIDRSQLL